jgi:hypothetical protein
LLPPIFVHAPATFGDAAHCQRREQRSRRADMKNIVTVILALIPLVAVLSACITCP